MLQHKIFYTVLNMMLRTKWTYCNVRNDCHSRKCLEGAFSENSTLTYSGTSSANISTFSHHTDHQTTFCIHIDENVCFHGKQGHFYISDLLEQ